MMPHNGVPRVLPRDTAYQRLIDALHAASRRVNEHGHDRATAQCPAHDDGRPSLSLRAIDGQVLAYCFAGCDTSDIVAALGLTMADLFDDPQGATYNYPDGRIVQRTPTKRFSQSGNKTDRSLYHADRVGDAPVVYVVEGEKDVHAIEAAGGIAVCSAMGAGKAKHFDWTQLAGKSCVVVADKDKPGYAHAHDVAELLAPIAAAVRVVEPAIGKDAADHIAADRALDDFVSINVDPAEGAIEHRLSVLRIDREARRRLDEEERPQVVLPPVKSLATLLAEPDTHTAYRIDQVMPADGRIMASAQFKGGKSTLIANMIRSLSDTEPFLGRFTVHTPAQHLVLIDDELAENTIRRWLRDQGIVNTAAVADVVALRGKLAAFNLIDDRTRSQWAARLRDLGCDYLILDCLRPVLDALGLDESRDGGKFLVAFDALLDEAGVRDAMVVHHMGHASERSRGDSRFQDWPDAIWRIVRETEQPDSPRFFTAYGRDVDVPEGRLSFDPATRRLTYAPGSRRDAKAQAAQVDVVKLLADRGKGGDPLSKNEIEDQLGGDHTQKAIRAGITLAVEHRLVKVTEGPHRAKLHAIAHPCAQCGMPVSGGGQQHENCSSGVEGLFS